MEETTNFAGPYGYTGEWYGGYIDLLYLRARWYAPETGTFLSVDLVETEPPYQYVGGNVVNRTDPFGTQTCPTGTCGPDITSWLMKEMESHHSYGEKVYARYNKMMTSVTFRPTPLADPLWLVTLGKVPFNIIVDELNMGSWSAVPSTLIALRFWEYALYGLAVDYNNVDYGQADGCGNGRCVKSGILSAHTPVTLCDKCVDSSDIGNMMFGLGGEARGFDIGTTWASASSYNLLTGQPFLSPDGKGAIPGYLIGKSRAYSNKWAFCAILNNTKFIGYNEENEQHSYCQACKKEGTGPKAAPVSSLYYVSRPDIFDNGDYPTIQELKGKIEGKLNEWMQKMQ